MRSGTLDLLLGLAMLGVAAGLLWETTSEEFAQVAVGHEFGPAFYPRILLVLWILVAAALAVRGVRLRGDAAQPQRWRLLAGFAALTTGYVWLIGAAGFLLASLPFYPASMLFLGYRQPVAILLAGFGFPVAAWYVFTYLIGIPLPNSPWFDRF